MIARNGTAAHASDEKLLVFSSNMDEALRSHYQRTKAEAVDSGPMPFDRVMSFEDIVRAEDDGGEGEISDYEMRQRYIGVRAFLRWLKTRAGIKSDEKYRPGPVSNILMQLFAAGRALQDPFFSSLSFTESGLLFSQTKAAASFRGRMISGILEEAGLKGTRLPGQKSPLSIARYAEVQKGNKNRARKVRQRQGSFLSKLKTVKNSHTKVTKGTKGKAVQRTFTRKLNQKHDLKKQRSVEAPVQPKITPTVSGQRVSGGPRHSENGGGVARASRATGAPAKAGGCPSGGIIRSGPRSSTSISGAKAAFKIA
jgi:hypothetical protein